jgi:hypothetical protein
MDFLFVLNNLIPYLCGTKNLYKEILMNEVRLLILSMLTIGYIGYRDVLGATPVYTYPARIAYLNDSFWYINQNNQLLTAYIHNPLGDAQPGLWSSYVPYGLVGNSDASAIAFNDRGRFLVYSLVKRAAREIMLDVPLYNIVPLGHLEKDWWYVRALYQGCWSIHAIQASTGQVKTICAQKGHHYVSAHFAHNTWYILKAQENDTQVLVIQENEREEKETVKGQGIYIYAYQPQTYIIMVIESATKEYYLCKCVHTSKNATSEELFTITVPVAWVHPQSNKRALESFRLFLPFITPEGIYYCSYQYTTQKVGLQFYSWSTKKSKAIGPTHDHCYAPWVYQDTVWFGHSNEEGQETVLDHFSV